MDYNNLIGYRNIDNSLFDESLFSLSSTLSISPETQSVWQTPRPLRAIQKRESTDQQNSSFDSNCSNPSLTRQKVTKLDVANCDFSLDTFSDRTYWIPDSQKDSYRTEYYPNSTQDSVCGGKSWENESEYNLWSSKHNLLENVPPSQNNQFCHSTPEKNSTYHSFSDTNGNIFSNNCSNTQQNPYSSGYIETLDWIDNTMHSSSERSQPRQQNNISSTEDSLQPYILTLPGRRYLFCQPIESVPRSSHIGQPKFKLPILPSVNVDSMVSKASRDDKNIPSCNFCMKNGESAKVYMGHMVKVRRGRRNVVSCPVLRNLVCPVCGATGDDAHTETYCPYVLRQTNGQRPTPTTLLIKGTKTNSSGKPRF